MSNTVDETKSMDKGTRMLRRYIYPYEAAEAASRFVTKQGGKRYVIRFSRGQQIEHYILLISFTLLGITGVSQTFSNTFLGNFILMVLGGIDSTRQIHHFSAFIFGILSINHVLFFVFQYFVDRRNPKMLPTWSDLKHVTQMLKFNLGKSHIRPRFDRYTFEEKAEYWALIWGTVIMGLTGLLQWFPVLSTYYLPGWAIPVAREIHKWEAILAILAILTWHIYHTVLKKLNTSIFTGLMSIVDMQEEHPLELLYLERAAEALKSSTWPVLIEIPLEDHLKDSVDETSQEKEVVFENSGDAK